MTELEPAYIGDTLAREMLNAGGYGFAHQAWTDPLGAELALCGTTVPGNVRLAMPPGPPGAPPDMPMLDLSWTPPDVHAILHELLDALDLLPPPPPVTADDIVGVLGATWIGGVGTVAWVRAQRDDPATDEPDWPTMEMKAITPEEP
jgi:hypothetical protein